MCLHDLREIVINLYVMKHSALFAAGGGRVDG